MAEDTLKRTEDPGLRTELKAQDADPPSVLSPQSSALSLTPCAACGAVAEIVERREDGQTTYQGYCPACGATAQPATNRQRAIDFWEGWQEGTPEMGASEEPA